MLEILMRRIPSHASLLGEATATRRRPSPLESLSGVWVPTRPLAGIDTARGLLLVSQACRKGALSVGSRRRDDGNSHPYGVQFLLALDFMHLFLR